MKTRHCEKFDLYTAMATGDFPLEMFLKEDPEDGKLYLPLEGREEWFRYRYPHGKVDTQTVTLDKDQAVVTARVYKDVADAENEFLASVTVQRTRSDWGSAYHDNATKAAIAKALGAAGYGNPVVIRHKGASTMLQVPPFLDEIDVEHPISLRTDRAQERRAWTAA